MRNCYLKLSVIGISPLWHHKGAEQSDTTSPTAGVCTNLRRPHAENLKPAFLQELVNGRLHLTFSPVLGSMQGFSTGDQGEALKEWKGRKRSGVSSPRHNRPSASWGAGWGCRWRCRPPSSRALCARRWRAAGTRTPPGCACHSASRCWRFCPAGRTLQYGLNTGADFFCYWIVLMVTQMGLLRMQSQK